MNSERSELSKDLGRLIFGRRLRRRTFGGSTAGAETEFYEKSRIAKRMRLVEYRCVLILVVSERDNEVVAAEGGRELP